MRSIKKNIFTNIFSFDWNISIHLFTLLFWKDVWNKQRSCINTLAFILQAITPQTIIWLPSLSFSRHSRIIFPYIPPLNARKRIRNSSAGKPFHGRRRFLRFSHTRTGSIHSLYTIRNRTCLSLLKPRDDI